MQLEVGKKYVARDGSIVHITKHDPTIGSYHPYITNKYDTYAPTGEYNLGYTHERDLIALYSTVEPAATENSVLKAADLNAVTSHITYTPPNPLRHSGPQEPQNAATATPEPQHRKFTKADTDKPMLSLIDPQFIISLGDILTFGAKKYAKDNWQLCEDPTRYKDALLRHTYAYLGGELLDPESGIPHTACMAFNVMALQWFDNNKGA